jgi:hypothetical protein
MRSDHQIGKTDTINQNRHTFYLRPLVFNENYNFQIIYFLISKKTLAINIIRLFDHNYNKNKTDY